jgi:hypothetical protein
LLQGQVYRAGDARFRRLLMNKLQLTKGELTKIILEEVRNLQEQPVDNAVEAAKEELEQILQANPTMYPLVRDILKVMKQ